MARSHRWCLPEELGALRGRYSRVGCGATDVEASCRRAPVPSVFICNAGIGGSHLLLRQREDDWAEVVATNLTGTFHCLRAMAPPLLARGGGSIIVIGSYAGFHGSIGQAAYAGQKPVSSVWCALLPKSGDRATSV